jgi:elongation factor G
VAESRRRREIPALQNATDLRSQTQGRATFSMEFGYFKQAPRDVQEEVIEKARKEKQAAK